MLIKFDDEDFKNSFDDLISGLLPHENYDPKMFLDIYMGIQRFVKIDEMSLEYRILFNIFEDILKVYSSVTKQSLFITVTRDIVSDILQSSLMEFMVTDGSKFREWFEKRGINSNFSVPLNQENGASALYNEVMDVYDRCFEKQTPSGEVIGRFVTFKNLFVSAVSQATLNAQVEIISDKLYYKNRVYKGSEDWIRFMSETIKDLENRLNDDLNTTSVILDDSVKVEEIFREARQTFKPLGNFGIPDVDGVPMSTNMLCVITGNSNAGKTLYSCYLSSLLLCNGKRVLFMCGEAPKEKILSYITSNFIYRKYGKFVSNKQILDPRENSEEVQRLINLASIEIASNSNDSKLILRDSYTYENLYSELVNDYEMFGMDAVFIDHSLSLKRTYSLSADKDCVDALAVQSREFKKAYPVFMCITSHLSVEAQNELSRKGIILNTASVTRASSTLHAEADSILIIVSKPELDKQSLRGFIHYKSRDSVKSYKYYYMRVLFNANEWFYDLRDQDGEENSVDANIALSEVENAYLSDNTEDSIDLDFD